MGYGTRNYLEQSAMTEEEALAAIEKGKEIVNIISYEHCNCIGLGEMGIGNTSSAALIMSAITAMNIEECTGRGTGVNDGQLQTKIETLKKVYAIHQLQLLQHKPVQLLSAVGGYEIAMMVGAYLQAAANHMIIVVDGFIATAALLLAVQLQPEVTQYCIFAHNSGEQGHEKMLQFLQAKPLLHLGLRLGEGTGAALAIPLIKNATAFLNDMASFDSANISAATQ
jgi:nicotinate-nucleotide--dimethylbenzimidazole phosphoribosyltransferase